MAWKDGKVWEYKSTNAANPTQVSEVPGVQDLVPTPSVVKPSSKKHHHTFQKNCSYWVHQWCVGLYYKKADNLAKVPFYCPEHGKKKETKISKRKLKFFHVVF